MKASDLPGYNCAQCGYQTCREYAKTTEVPDKCPFSKESPKKPSDLEGVLDGLKADFRLCPLPLEPSCKEFLLPTDQSIELKAGDVIRYRPLGCPITHFARILDVEHKIISVHLCGPIDTEGYKDIGMCIVCGFEGLVDGILPHPGETVRFIPNGCMMQKVHSGVVVHVEDNFVRIEGIDLKIFVKDKDCGKVTNPGGCCT